jgi:hypothetical protein
MHYSDADLNVNYFQQSFAPVARGGSPDRKEGRPSLTRATAAFTTDWFLLCDDGRPPRDPTRLSALLADGPAMRLQQVRPETRVSR